VAGCGTINTFFEMGPVNTQIEERAWKFIQALDFIIGVPKGI
jgi:hypothetical protein